MPVHKRGVIVISVNVVVVVEISKLISGIFSEKA